MPNLDIDDPAALHEQLDRIARSRPIVSADMAVVVSAGLYSRRRRQAAMAGTGMALAIVVALSTAAIRTGQQDQTKTQVAAVAESSRPTPSDVLPAVPVSTVAPGTVLRMPDHAPLPSGYAGPANPTCFAPIAAGFYIGARHVWFYTLPGGLRVAVPGPDNTNPCSFIESVGDQTQDSPGFYRTIVSSPGLGVPELPVPVLAFGRAPVGTVRIDITDSSGVTSKASSLQTGSGDYGVAFIAEERAQVTSVIAYDGGGRPSEIPLVPVPHG